MSALKSVKWNSLPCAVGIVFLFLLLGIVYFVFTLLFSARLPNFGEREVIINTLPLQEQWQYKTGERIRQISTLNNSVFVWYGPRVDALDAGSGILKWNFPVNSSEMLFSDTGDNTVAFFPSAREKQVTVLDARTGQLQWNRPLSDPWSLAIGDQLLFVGLQNVSAYNLANGKLVWQMAKQLPSHTVIKVVYHAGRLYVVAWDQLYELDPKDGHVLRSFETIGNAEQSIANSTMFGVSRENGVSATDLKTGRMLWQQKNIRPYVFGLPPAVIGNSVYVITDNLELVALDPKSGAIKWKSDTVKRPFSHIVELAGQGYVLSDTGRLYGFDLATGQAVGELDTGAGLPINIGNTVSPSLSVIGNTLVFSFGDSPVFSYQLKPPHR